MLSKVPKYDPRFDRAQTIEGAKARYIELDDYDIDNLEDDLDRLLEQGENPDGPKFGGQEMAADGGYSPSTSNDGVKGAGDIQKIP